MLTCYTAENGRMLPGASPAAALVIMGLSAALSWAWFKWRRWL